jgi:glutathione S-transferase
MLTVHHLGVSQSERIVWLCEELGLDYELKRYDRDPQTRLAPAAYKALHPMGTAPVITDGKVVMSESGAIVEYILARYGKGRLAVAPEQPNFADYVFWLHFANGSMMPHELIRLIGSMLGANDSPVLQSLMSRSDRGYTLVEKRLGEAEWFAGPELTAADVMMVFTLTTMRMFEARDLSAYPHIRRYLKRVGERPAYRRAMAKGDPGMTPLLE